MCNVMNVVTGTGGRAFAAVSVKLWPVINNIIYVVVITKALYIRVFTNVRFLVFFI